MSWEKRLQTHSLGHIETDQTWWPEDADDQDAVWESTALEDGRDRVQPRSWKKSTLKLQVGSAIPRTPHHVNKNSVNTDYGLSKQRLEKQGPRKKGGLQDNYRKHPWHDPTNLLILLCFFFFEVTLVCNTHCHCPQTHCVAASSHYVLSSEITEVHYCVQFQRFLISSLRRWEIFLVAAVTYRVNEESSTWERDHERSEFETPPWWWSGGGKERDEDALILTAHRADDRLK